MHVNCLLYSRPASVKLQKAYQNPIVQHFLNESKPIPKYCQGTFKKVNFFTFIDVIVTCILLD